MISIIIVLIIVIGVVACVYSKAFFEYKTKELDYKKIESEYAERTIGKRTDLEKEQERTKQYLLEKEKEQEKTKREAEITKQLEIKASYKKGTGSSLY